MTLAYHTGRTAATKDAKQCQGVIEPMTVDLTKKGIVAFANRLWEWRDKGITIENENEDTYKPTQDKKQRQNGPTRTSHSCQDVQDK